MIYFRSRRRAVFNCYADVTVEACGGAGSNVSALRSLFNEALDDWLNCDDKLLSSDEVNAYRGAFYLIYLL